MIFTLEVRMERKKPSQLRGYPMMLCVGIAFVFAGFQSAKAQDDLPTKVPSAMYPESQTTVQTRKNTLVPSKRYKLSVDLSETVYALPAVDVNKIEKRAANQIGVNRTVNVSMKSHGKPYPNADGSEIRILSIRSPGAVGIRVHFENFDLPDR